MKNPTFRDVESLVSIINSHFDDVRLVLEKARGGYTLNDNTIGTELAATRLSEVREELYANFREQIAAGRNWYKASPPAPPAAPEPAPLPWTKEAFIAYLEGTLIPDLCRSGSVEMAEDLETAVKFMKGAKHV